MLYQVIQAVTHLVLDFPSYESGIQFGNLLIIVS